MADLSFVYDSSKGFADLKIENGDFVFGDDLQTAVGMSLFTDRRATDQEIRDFQTGTVRSSRRGYWANTYRSFPQGSALWLLSRSKRQEITRTRAENLATESLDWLKKERIAASVKCTATLSGPSKLDLTVRITKPSGELLNFKYVYAW